MLQHFDPKPSYTDFTTIKISSIKRDHAGEWNKSTDCPTILHETFHHLGLADEYRETSSGLVEGPTHDLMPVEEEATILDKDCRAVVSKPSIMSNPYHVINYLEGHSSLLHPAHFRAMGVRIDAEP